MTNTERFALLTDEQRAEVRKIKRDIISARSKRGIVITTIEIEQSFNEALISIGAWA